MPEEEPVDEDGEKRGGAHSTALAVMASSAALHSRAAMAQKGVELRGFKSVGPVPFGPRQRRGVSSFPARNRAEHTRASDLGWDPDNGTATVWAAAQAGRFFSPCTQPLNRAEHTSEPRLVWDPDHATSLRLRAARLWCYPASRAGHRLQTLRRSRDAMVAGACPAPLLFMASAFSMCSPPRCVAAAGSEASDVGGKPASSGHGGTSGTGESGSLLPRKRAQGEDAAGELEQSDSTRGETVHAERGDGGGDSTFPLVSVPPQPAAPRALDLGR